MHHCHAEMTTWPKVETASWFAWRHQLNVWSISVLISYIWTKFYIEVKHHTINMTECSKFTWLENLTWWRPPSWISKNVNNYEWDRAVCAKFGGQMQMTHGQNSKPKLFLRDVIIMMNKDVYIKRMLGTLCAMMSRPTRALNLQIFMFSLCRTHLFALLSGLLICHTSPTNKLY